MRLIGPSGFARRGEAERRELKIASVWFSWRAVPFGYPPNRKLSDGGIEGIPCVEFNMRFFDAPHLHAIVDHRIVVERIGKMSFAVRHVYSEEGRSFAEVLDSRVWAIHGDDGRRKAPLPSEVLVILNSHKEPEAGE
ncbi:acyl-CoA thioesterase FadM [Bradyrhizobium sp. LB14.3]|uniref:hypothetical protein n=1 Tax=Bradyrhizobium sp. LB14.3 TaxID=3156328 RepID=UPI0033958813